MVTIPQCNMSGMPCILKGRLDVDNATLYILKKCEPSVMEKNWMPFGSKAIYSVTPFVLKTCLDAGLQPVSVELTVDLSGYHGSSNGIPWTTMHSKNTWILLIHKKDSAQMVHRWMIYDRDTHHVSVSPPFVFYRHSYIEFVCNIAPVNDVIVVALGVNDDAAFLVEVSVAQIDAMFAKSAQ